MEEIGKNSYIHTFTREFTEILLTELDTITDFIDYLKEKENFLNFNKSLIVMGGEEELLAYYLMHERKFDFPSSDSIVFNGGFWDELNKRPEYQEKKKLDLISYGWDEIINIAHTSGNEYVHVAKELARPNRFNRRILSKSFLDAHIIAHREKRKNSFKRLMQLSDTTYCFLFYNDVEPRKIRKNMLSFLCFVARGYMKNNKTVIGIATEMEIQPVCSYDFCYLYIPNWTKNEQKEMDRIQKETGMLTATNKKSIHEDEYPKI